MAKVKKIIAQCSYLMEHWNKEKNEEVGNDPNEMGVGSHKKIWLDCEGNEKFGAHTYETPAFQAARGGCPVCSCKVIIPELNSFAATCRPENRRVIEEWKSVEPTPYDVAENSHAIITFECSKCHHIYTAPLYSRTGKQQSDCPHCSCSKTSKAQQAIYYYVKGLYPDATNRDRTVIQFANGRAAELDVFIPSKSVAIEFDGYYHHNEEQIKRDQEKDALCIEKGIRLIRIKQVKKVTEQDSDDLIYVPRRMSPNDINQMIAKIYHLLGKDQYADQIDYMRDKDAILADMDANLFTKSLADACPEIALDYLPDWNNGRSADQVGYTSALPATWCCHMCGHIWDTEYVFSRTQKNTECPKCSKTMKDQKQELKNEKVDLLFKNIRYVCHDAREHFRVKTEEGTINVDIYIPSMNLAIVYKVDSFHTPDVLQKRKDKQGSLKILEIRETKDCDSFYYDVYEEIIRVGDLSMEKFVDFVKFVFDHLNLDKTIIATRCCFEQDVLDLYKGNPRYSVHEIQQLLGLSRNHVESIRHKLIQEGYLKRVGADTCSRWLVVKEKYN